MPASRRTPRLALAAFQGREAEAVPLIEASHEELVRRGEGQGLTFIHWATAVLYNGLGRYEEALAAAQQAVEDPRELAVSRLGLGRADRGGRPEREGRARGSMPSAGFRRRPRPVAPTGRSASRPARGRC